MHRSCLRLNYRDATTNLGTPAYPRTDINNVNHLAVFTWNDNNKTMLDAEYALPTSVQSLPLNATDVQVFPNPATDNVNIGFIATRQDITTLLVSDIPGNK